MTTDLSFIAKLDLAPALMSQTSKIAERLLAHARLCRQIAGQSWNEDTAAKLQRMAEDCEQAVAELGHPGPRAPLPIRH